MIPNVYALTSHKICLYLIYQQVMYFTCGRCGCLCSELILQKQAKVFKMYTWPVTQAKRGVNEVVSCLSHYIRSNIPDTMRTLYVFTDGCRGQNHNHTTVNYLQTLVLNGRFDKVVHRLTVRGHSYLQCHCDFGVTEKL